MLRKLLLLLTLCLAVFATDLVEAQPYTWQNFTNKSQITDLAGYNNEVWVATTGGIVRLSSQGEVVRSYINGDGLGSVDATFVRFASDQIAYFGSSDGYLSAFDLNDETFAVTRLQGRSGEPLKLVAADVDPSYLWIATDIGIIKFDRFRHGGEVKETYRTLGNFPAETAVLDVLLDDTLLIAATPRGLALASNQNEFLLDPTQWTTIGRGESGFSADTASALALVGDRIYVGTESGLFRLNEDLTMTMVAGTEDWHVFDMVSGPTSLLTIAVRGDVRFLSLIDAQNNVTRLENLELPNDVNVGLLEPGLVLGTESDGVYVMQSDSTFTQVSLPGPVSNDLIGGGVTSDGTVYAASRGSGLSIYRGGVWSDAQPTRRDIVSALVDNEDNLWLGSYGDGVFRRRPDGTTVLFNKNNSPLLGNDDDPSNTYIVINAISEDQDDNIWFSSYRGVGRRSLLAFNEADSLWAYFEAEDGIVSDRSQAVAGGAGYAALGDENQGIAFLDYGASPFDKSDDEIGIYSTSRRLPSGSVTSMVVDLDNRLWVGTNLGLAYFDDDIRFFFPVTLPEGISSDVQALEVDSRNNLWVGTTGGLGFISFGQTRTETFTTANSQLLSDDIRALDFDEHTGRLLIFTSGGLSILDYNLQGSSTTSDVLPYPNPFEVNESSTTHLRFTFGQRAEVRIYNVAGEMVRCLQQTEFDDGWDGRNDYGTLVASGVYIFELLAEDGSRYQGKVLVVRR